MSSRTFLWMSILLIIVTAAFGHAHAAQLTPPSAAINHSDDNHQASSQFNSVHPFDIKQAGTKNSPTPSPTPIPIPPQLEPSQTHALIWLALLLVILYLLGIWVGLQRKK